MLDHPSWQNGFLTHQADAAPLLLGCHRGTWRLIRTLDTASSAQAGVEIPLEFRLPDGRIVAYGPARLPGAFQWIVSLFQFSGLAWSDRWSLFSHLEQIWEQTESLPSDLESRTADEWLASIGQSQAARNVIWSPLAQWLTGNALACLSAAIFAQTLSTVFLGRASDARLTCLHGSLRERLLTPLRSALERLGVVIQPQTDLPSLRFEQHALVDVQLRDGTLLKADWYIAALPHQKVLALLPERLLTRFAYFAQIAELPTVPEITVQLTCRSIASRPRLLLLSEQPFHQLTVNARGPQEIRYRLSTIGNTSLAGLNDSQLIDLGRKTLHGLLPEVGTDGVHSIEVYHEDHAALSLQPGVAILRPIQKSPIQNFLVAGAWTDTGWPANLESAIVSAHRCADIITGHPA